MDGIDYLRVGVGKEIVVGKRPARGASAARLIVRRERIESLWNRGNIRYHLVLSFPDGEVISFDQVWEPEYDDRWYCPEYKTVPRETEAPRKTLMAALVIPESNDQLTGDADATDQLHRLPPADIKIVSQRSFASEVTYTPNAGCPEHTGINEVSSQITRERMLGSRPFQIGDIAYFVDAQYRYAICVGIFVYLLGDFDTSSTGEVLLSIQKRSLGDFSESWTSSLRLPRTVAIHRGVLIRSLKEENGALTVDLLNMYSKQLFTLQAYLTASLPGL